MQKIDFRKFNKLTQQKIKAGQKKGQALFNALYETNQKLAKEIVSTELDPFYKSNNALQSFYDWLLGDKKHD